MVRFLASSAARKGLTPLPGQRKLAISLAAAHARHQETGKDNAVTIVINAEGGRTVIAAESRSSARR